MLATLFKNLFMRILTPNQAVTLVKYFLAAFFLSLSANQSWADLNSPVALDIPSQALSDALIELGSQANITVVFPSAFNLDQESATLKGNYLPRQALDILLQDQPFEWEEFSQQVVAINRSTVEEKNEVVFKATPLTEIIVIGQQITGSRIKRLDLEGSAPVDIITNAEISARGVQTISDYLKYIPAVAGNSTSTAVSNGGDGTATITLRGLAASKTLVLINGHRTSNSGLAGDSVDLNSIPLSAVERIEVLKDGASAIYGSDAIAGVVNIILKREFEGTVVDQYFSETSRGDLKTSHTSILTGFAHNDTRFMLSASHFDQDGIYSRDRKLSANADGRTQGGVDQRSSATPFTRIDTPNLGTVVLESEDSDSSLISSYRPATDEDLYNYREETSSFSPSERSAIYFSLVRPMGSYSELFVQAGQTQTNAEVTFAAQPLFNAFEKTPVITGANNPYNPFGVELTDLRRRLVELGPRKQESEENAQRINAQIEGARGKIHWDFGINLNQTLAKKNISGLTDPDNIRLSLSDDCLLIPSCVPLDLFGPPGSIDAAQRSFIIGEEKIKGKSNLFEITANGDTLLEGVLKNPIALASGFAIRKEETKFKLEKSLDLSTPRRVQGERDVIEAYLESSFPILSGLPLAYQFDIDLALRYSDYSDFGNSSTPKFGIRYRPKKNVLLRASYSEGFRAPSLYELHQSQSTSFDVLNDPCTQIENIGVLIGCTQLSTANRLQIPNTVSGNMDLQPEQSVSKTVGFVWTPQFAEDLHLSIDWYHIVLKDVIDSRAQYVIDQNANLGLFSDQIQRDNDGNLIQVFSDFINVGNLQVEGFDTTLRYRKLNTASGNYIFSLNGANILRYNQRADPNSETLNLAGTFADLASEGAGAIPNWKINGGVSWSNTRWELSYNIVYIDSLRETIPRTQDKRTIESWTTQNIQISYLAGSLKNIRLSAGIDNIGDKLPPFAASAFNDNFDARTYELKGRTWYAKLRYFFD